MRPKFEAPPVVEAVLSVQFDSLVGYSSAHAGWFWKEYLDKLPLSASLSWNSATDAMRLEDQFEKFGQEDVWQAPQFHVKPVGNTPNRLQIIRSDNERMIQIQDTRLILNWRKQQGTYPSFDPLFEEFCLIVKAFESFVGRAGLGPLRYNQWELVYVDQIPKGDLWKSPGDWEKIFPGLTIQLVRANPLIDVGDENLSADWRFSLAKQMGRMYISFRHVRTPIPNSDILLVNFVGRGPVDEGRGWENGLQLGHNTMSDTFISITSKEAQSYWKRKT